MSDRNNNLISFMRTWWKMFAITLAFVAFSAGLFWLDAFRSYEAEVRVLVVGKSPAADVSRTVGSLAVISGNLSFYDRMLADDDMLQDPSEGLTPEKRRAVWNDMVSVSQDGKSGVLTISAKGEDTEAARRLARQTAQTLVSVAGLYYNIKTDIDIRIVDGPIAKTVIDRPFVYIATSLVSAFVATSAFFFLLFALPSMFDGKKKTAVPDNAHKQREEKQQYEYGDAVPYIDPRKFIPEKPSSLPFGAAYRETSAVVPPVVRAEAPSNLPIADESIALPVSDEALPFGFEAMPYEAIDDGEVAEFPVRGEHEIGNGERTLEAVIMGGDEFHAHEAEQRGEPTVEEYKRRLNELLQGGK